jgi:hypothetical protein
MNDLYANEWSLYQNHFCPSMKLLEKKRINSKYHKKYDSPRTPYERVMASEHVSDEAKEHLKTTAPWSQCDLIRCYPAAAPDAFWFLL